MAKTSKKMQVPEYVKKEAELLAADPFAYLRLAIGDSFKVLTDAGRVGGIIEAGKKQFWKTVALQNAFGAVVNEYTFGSMEQAPLYSAASLWRVRPRLGWACEGRLWECKIELEFKSDGQPVRKYGGSYSRPYRFETASVSEPVLIEKLAEDIAVIPDTRSYSTLWEQLQDESFFAGKPAARMGLSSVRSGLVLCMAVPQIETLYQEGYHAVTEKIKDAFFGHDIQAMAAVYNLTKPGKTAEEVFRMPESVYSIMKVLDIGLIEMDGYRKLVKSGKIEPEDIPFLSDKSIDKKDMTKVRHILGEKWEGRRIFSARSLVEYLGRLDREEGLEKTVALGKLSEYLDGCAELGIRPEIGSDSLIREHDVVAAIRFRTKYGSGQDDDPAVWIARQGLNFEDGEYFIRSVRDADDLKAESLAQRSAIMALGQDRQFFVMRKKSDPDKSLITVELGKRKQILMCALSGNRMVTEKEHLDFLDKWLSWMESGYQNGIWQKVAEIVDRKRPGLDSPEWFKACNIVFDRLMQTGDEVIASDALNQSA